jgi:GT2 family glycosyltransferase
MANLAVRSTGRDHLCLMADDVTAADDGWLGELLGRIADPCVGAVSPLSVGMDGLVRDAGVVLGPGFATAPAFAGANAGGDGYGGMLAVAHQQSALDIGCLLTWRGDYLAVGGMDEIQFAADFADIDFCLKLRAARRRIVTTPHTRIIRAGNPRAATPEASRRCGAALRALRARWGEALAADPYYNPLLALDHSPYSALAWPARDAAARRAEAPVPTSIPSGF